MKAVIIELGSMGGSLRLCLKENKLVSYVYGLDSSKGSKQDALDLGLVHELIESEDLHLCDMIFIATPVNATMEILQKLIDLPSNTIIIGLGSIKGRIIEKLPAKLIKQALFAHPMARIGNSGPEAAFKELCKDAVCVLCDSEVADDLHQERTVEISSHLGMRIVFMDSTVHDYHAAVISHLPHVISSPLADFVMKEGDKGNIVHSAGGSPKGMSGVAKLSPIMWGSIFKQNKDNVLSSIEFSQKELEFCRKMAEEDRDEKLKSWM